MSICKQVLGMSMGVASFNKVEFGAVVTHYATHHIGLHLLLSAAAFCSFGLDQESAAITQLCLGK